MSQGWQLERALCVWCGGMRFPATLLLTGSNVEYGTRASPWSVTSSPTIIRLQTVHCGVSAGAAIRPVILFGSARKPVWYVPGREDNPSSASSVAPPSGEGSNPVGENTTVFA